MENGKNELGALGEDSVESPQILVIHNGTELTGTVQSLEKKGVTQDVLATALAATEKGQAKSNIQREIAKVYGVEGDQSSAAMSLVGKVGDAASLLIDISLSQDMLAVEATKDTPYGAKRIELFEEQYGEGSWASSVAFAQEWHEKRKSGDIAMPFDSKGLASVVTESAQLGGLVKQVISAS